MSAMIGVREREREGLTNVSQGGLEQRGDHAVEQQPDVEQDPDCRCDEPGEEIEDDVHTVSD